MKKYIALAIILSIFCNFNLPLHAKTIKKSVSKKTVKKVQPQQKPAGYTVPVAKAEAFKDVKTYLPAIYYRADLTDKYYDVNMSYMKKQINSSADQERLLFPFFLGETLISYGVRYSNKPDRVFYYNSKGNLLRIEIDNNNPQIYPKRTITYNNKGNLHTVVLYISEKEQYNFDGKGNLVVHWIGERGFNRMGQPLKIRRSL